MGVEKKCPRCGGAFVCTNDRFCQCVGVSLTESARQHIRSAYEGCLCRQCLEQIAVQYS